MPVTLKPFGIRRFPIEGLRTSRVSSKFARANDEDKLDRSGKADTATIASLLSAFGYTDSLRVTRILR